MATQPTDQDIAQAMADVQRTTNDYMIIKGRLDANKVKKDTFQASIDADQPAMVAARAAMVAARNALKGLL